ncbi:exodeoxyribonuclease VII large subunit, partial [Alphaproteobacteria bacterium]|nr:exodeoxyribonuclease VII large subunit [Alphaproteobacteria bacterium]
LPQPARLVETASQRLDDWGERLALALRTGLGRRQDFVARLNATLPSPMRQLEAKHDGLRQRSGALDRAAAKALGDHAHALERLDPARRLVNASQRWFQNAETRLASAAGLLDSYSYEKTLERGFVLVRAGDAVISTAEAATPGLAVELQFAKGEGRAAVIGDGAPPAKPVPKPSKPVKKQKPRPSDDSQGSLL